MDVPQVPLFQEDQHQADTENEFSQQEQQQMQEIWVRLKAKKDAKHPRTSTNTTTSGSPHYNEHSETPIQPFRQLVRQTTPQGPSLTQTVGLEGSATSNAQHTYHQGVSSGNWKEEDLQYTTDSTAFPQPQFLFETATTPTNNWHEKFAPQRQLTSQERLDFLNTDNVRLFLENRRLTEENSKLKQENKSLKEVSAAMNSELIKLRIDFAQLSKNSISIEAFKAELARVSGIAPNEQRPPNGRLTLQRQHSPVRHQSPPRVQVAVSPVNTRMVRSPPRQTVIVSPHGPQQLMNIPVAPFRNQAPHERIVRPSNFYSEELLRFQQQEQERVKQQPNNGFLPVQALQARTPQQAPPVQISQQSSRTLQQASSTSGEEPPSWKEVAIPPEMSARSKPAQPLDAEKQRQLRNAKLIYETENAKLKQEMSSKDARISQLLQELARSEGNSEYEATRYTAGSRLNS